MGGQVDVRRVWLVSGAVAAAISGVGVVSAQAAVPAVVWQKAGIKTGYPNAVFTADGAAILISIASGFELRRSSDGGLLNTVTLPAASRSYDAVALSPDKTTMALSLFNNAVGTVELWRVSTSTLARTITTDAVRNMKGIAYSSAGLIAVRERFAYGGGGNLRVFRASDGSLVKKLGPVARNSAPGGVGFSPDGAYLAVEDSFSLQGLWILRTTDYSAARSISGAGFFSWVSDSASLWVASTGYQQIRVSDGAVLKNVTTGSIGVSAVTPDNRFLFAWDIVNGAASNTLRFNRTSDGGTQLLYTLSPGTMVWSNGVNAQQTLFTYEICPSDCTVYVATLPPL